MIWLLVIASAAAGFGAAVIVDRRVGWNAVGSGVMTAIAVGGSTVMLAALLAGLLAQSEDDLYATLAALGSFGAGAGLGYLVSSDASHGRQ